MSYQVHNFQPGDVLLASQLNEMDNQIALNERLESSIADEFSSSSTYAVGDYVIYEGQLYQCTTAVTTAGSWNSSNWTQAVLGNDVNDLKSAFDGIMDNPNVMDYSQAVLLTRYGISNGTVLNTWNDNSKDIKFPVMPGETYTLYSPYFNRSGICGNNSGLFEFGETYTAMSINLHGNYGEFVVPNDVSWVLINYYSGTEEQIINDIKLYKQPYATLDTTIKVKTDVMPSNVVYYGEDGLPPLFDELKSSFALKHLPITMNSGKLLNNNGTVEDYDNTAYCVSNQIDISAYDFLGIEATASYPKALFAFYDSAGVFITAKTTDTGVITAFSGYVNVPDNAKYVRVSQYIGTGYKLSSVSYIDGVSVTKWAGKKWVVIGDSLTEINSTSTKGIMSMLLTKLGFLLKILA